MALLEAYPRLGQPLFPRNTWRASLIGDEFTDISQDLITALLRSAGPCPLDELNGIACDAIKARYMLAGTSLCTTLMANAVTMNVRRLGDTQG